MRLAEGFLAQDVVLMLPSARLGAVGTPCSDSLVLTVSASAMSQEAPDRTNSRTLRFQAGGWGVGTTCAPCQPSWELESLLHARESAGTTGNLVGSSVPWEMGFLLKTGAPGQTRPGRTRVWLSLGWPHICESGHFTQGFVSCC